MRLDNLFSIRLNRCVDDPVAEGVSRAALKSPQYLRAQIKCLKARVADLESESADELCMAEADRLNRQYSQAKEQLAAFELALKNFSPRKK